MSRLLGLAFVCALTASAAGCIAQDDRRIGREMAHDDLPRCYQRARFLEERGLEALDEGGAARSKQRQLELYDQAIRFFRDAIGLYEDELIRDAGAPAERRRNAELEIERLEGMVVRTHKARPL